MLYGWYKVARRGIREMNPFVDQICDLKRETESLPWECHVSAASSPIPPVTAWQIGRDSLIAPEKNHDALLPLNEISGGIKTVKHRKDANSQKERWRTRYHTIFQQAVNAV
jgi:hypothetical protein